MSAHAPIHWLTEAELLPFDPPAVVDPAADDASNVAAFLDMLAHAEIGPPMLADPRSDNGYRIIVGSMPSKLILLDDYRDHPRRSIHLPSYNIRSTAAGRYQFLIRTWDDLVNRFKLRDFSPASQDAGAVQLIRQCRALALVHDGKVREAIHACRTIWASLPGAGYGQREVATDELVEVYRRAGGNVA